MIFRQSKTDYIIMKSIYLIPFVLLLLMNCNKGSDEQKSDNGLESIQLKVAAYNVEVGRSATAEEIGEALKPYDFDIVGFSEAPGGNWSRNVANMLGLDYVVSGRYSTAGHEDKYKSIISRTPLYDYEEILMTDTLHTATKAKTVIQGKEIAVYSVHFPFGWRDQAHIDETTAKISSFVEHVGVRQEYEISVVLGDFNFIPSNAESRSDYYEMFVDAGLDFSWMDLSIDVTQRNTHNAFEAADEGSGNVIDHIMYNTDKIKAVDGNIIEMEEPLSDHKPIWALLQLNL